jgi:hypothetical protein
MVQGQPPIQGISKERYRTVATASWLKETALVSNYWGCRHAKEEMQKKGSPREHPRIQLEGCSLQNLPPQLCPLRWHFEVSQNKMSNQEEAGPIDYEPSKNE